MYYFITWAETWQQIVPQSFLRFTKVVQVPKDPYSEVPNRRADQNKRAGLEKSATLLAYLPLIMIEEK